MDLCRVVINDLLQKTMFCSKQLEENSKNIKAVHFIEKPLKSPV